ncbi:MAG: CoB--CoM heterodisulfide reductase iron-sulfur subunit B family protein [Candidatus Bipolaricaulaceae bacterium]
MKRILYFPGCALKDQAQDYERATKKALEKLGYALQELPRWNCCGTVYSLARDDLMRHVGPVRNLLRVQEAKEEKLLTLCAMCYNTLQRSAQFVRDPEILRRINAFMDEEEDFRGGVHVLHLVQFLVEEIGEEALSQAVTRPLVELRLGAYYGCALLRPKEVGVDDPDRPEILERIISGLGAEAVFFPERVECCGAYLTVTRPDVVRKRVGEILLSAAQAGAQALLTACPLCKFNLEERRPLGAPKIRVFYVGEALAWALGVAAVPPALVEHASTGVMSA